MENQPLHAARQKKIDFAGKGTGMQLAALLCPILGGAFLGGVGLAIGLIAGIALFISGSNAATRYICGNCKNRLDSKAVKICPACHAELS